MGALKLSYYKRGRDLEINPIFFVEGLEKNASEEKNCVSDYRYGYQGSEKDDEIKGSTGTSYTTHFRQLDPRLGRWFSVDPKANLTSWESPYTSMANNPIWNTDVLGDKPKKKEAAAIAAHVYGDKKDGILKGGWKVSDRKVDGGEYDTEAGLKSNLYERTITK